MSDLIKSSALLSILLNPSLLVVYMIDVFAKLPPETFRSVVFRTGIISSFVFAIVALLGDVLFRDILQAQFASFEIFGGIVFLLIALRFVFDGKSAIAVLRGGSLYRNRRACDDAGRWHLRHRNDHARPQRLAGGCLIVRDCTSYLN